MQTLTTGGMEDFCKHWGINGMLSLMCCTFWIFSPTEGNTITEVVGREVILNCKKNSNGTINQLTWKRNGVALISFIPHGPLHFSEEAQRMNINMSESLLYALVIERVQMFHTGNYTCEINKEEVVLEQQWELIIIEAETSDQPVIAVAVTVPCVCCLIFILALTILLRVHKRHAEDDSPSAEMQEQEDIYENCLGTDVSQQHGYNQPHRYKPRTH